MTEDDLEPLPNEVVQDHILALAYHVDQGYITRRDAEHIYSRLLSRINKVNNTEGEIKAKYLGKEEGSKAYVEVLINDKSAQEALEYVAAFYGKDQDWVNEVKSNRYFHARAVVKDHDDQPIQKAMRKDGTFSKYIKTGKTPNQHLRELERSKRLHNTLNNLKDTTNKQQGDITDLKVKTSVLEKDVSIVMGSLSIEQPTLKDKVIYLRTKGFTVKEISTALNVSVSTINRAIRHNSN